MRFFTIIQLGLLFILLNSCISNKRVIYMQPEAGKPVLSYSRIFPAVVEDYKLQFNDVVEINIKTNDPLLNEMFDIGGSNRGFGMMGGVMAGGDIFYMTGYTLDNEGKIELPVLGEINLAGMTVEEAKIAIENKMKGIVVGDENLFVRIRLGGIRYSALGEFNRPGKYTILQNRLTIFEAIANAGDMNVLANRGNVLLIRQYPEGSKSFRINLNSDKIMDTEFYYLRPNDMIYVEPMKVRELGTGVNLLQTMQLLISVITVGVLIYTTSTR